MNSPRNKTTPHPIDQSDRGDGLIGDHLEDYIENYIEDYLDHLCTPLVGLVPCSVRRRLRMEAEEHLRALIAEFADDGLAYPAALDAAMREHGEPWRIGQAYADEWLRGRPDTPLSRFAAPYALHGLAWFGLLSVPTLLLVEQGCLMRGSVPPEWVGLLAALAPFAAGALTGYTAPARPVRAVWCALLLHIPVSFAAGCLLLPQREGLDFAWLQLLFWLPTGSVSAWTVAHFRLSLRRQRFLRRACAKTA